jgi:hypothetical protein
MRGKSGFRVAGSRKTGYYVDSAGWRSRGFKTKREAYGSLGRIQHAKKGNSRFTREE